MPRTTPSKSPTEQTRRHKVAAMMSSEVQGLAEHMSSTGLPTFVFAMTMLGDTGMSSSRKSANLTPAQARAMADRLEQEVASLRRIT